MNSLKNWDVEATWPINAPVIKLSRRGKAGRLPLPKEAHALVVGALATLSRLAGVTVGNASIGGKAVAIVLLGNVRFHQTAHGSTSLDTEQNADAL